MGLDGKKPIFLGEQGSLGYLEGLADGHRLTEESVVESLAEHYTGVIWYLFAALHTDNVLSSSIMENLSSKLGIATSHENEFQLGATGL